MPKQFEAPIPIFSNQLSVSPPSDFTGAAAIQELSVDNPLLVEQLRRTYERPEEVDEAARVFVIGQRLHRCAATVIEWSRLVLSVASADALRVDDAFLLAINPRLALSVEYLRLQTGREVINPESLTDVDLPEPDAKAVAATLDLMQETYPQLGKSELGRALRDPFSVTCWHPESHSSLISRLGRGRRVTVRRRVSCWATYCLAWTLGSETLAVRWWGMIAPRHAWASSPRHAVKKYAASKKRLVADLRAWGIIPNATPRQGPKANRPLTGPYIQIAEESLRPYLEHGRALATLDTA